MGKFIAGNVPDLKRKYQAVSGTIRNKVQFAKDAVGFMDSYEDLTEEAKGIARRVYDFIREQNKA